MNAITKADCGVDWGNLRGSEPQHSRFVLVSFVFRPVAVFPTFLQLFPDSASRLGAPLLCMLEIGGCKCPVCVNRHILCVRMQG